MLTLVVGARRQLSAAPAASASELRQQQVLWRSHFVGSAKLESDSQAARWTKLAAQPVSVQLREQTVGKLATAPFRALQGQLAAGAKDHAELLQPLLVDLFRGESFMEWRGTSNRTAQFALALKLSDDRAKAWNSNLATVLKAWTGLDPVPFNQNGVSGWQLRQAHAPDLIGVARSGQWIVVGLGQGTLSLFNDYVKHFKAGAVPFATDAQAWADVWVDGPQLQPRLPFPLPVEVPFTHVTLGAKDDSLRLKGTMALERDLGWNPEPWCVPTNLIREPLLSFTAARGVAPVLPQSDVFRALNLQPVPNEVYAWALSGSPFFSFLAVRAADATNQFKRLASELTSSDNPLLQRRLLGSIELASHFSAVVWKGLPIAVPRVQPTSDGKNQFLFAGLFPNVPRAKAPPSELLSQIQGRKQLAYYDWEVTEPRVNQWKTMLHLFQIATRQPMTGTNPATTQWLATAQKGAGNTVTEITVSGPRELSLTRKAPLGLTGFELVMLCHWLESADFPLSPHVAPVAPASRPAVRQRTGSQNPPAPR